MDIELKNQILQLLDGSRVMTVATNRADGWPQATAVAYVNDGLLMYFFVARPSQKFINIKRDPRVSVAIGKDFANPLDIKGLSLAGRAAIIEDKHEFDRIWGLFLKRFPEYADWPQPTPAMSPLLCISPHIVSVLDYSKGFGHSELVKIPAGDLPAGAQTETKRHHWLPFAR